MQSPYPDLRTIEGAQSHIPRYLFRYWRSKGSIPGHTSECNTPDSITPKLLLPNSSTFSSDFFSYTKTQLGAWAMSHMSQDGNRSIISEGSDDGGGSDGGDGPDDDPMTPYSTWSQSLAYVIAWALDARKRFPADETDAHVCILDTTKVDNVILHSEDIEIYISDLVTKDRWQYLAFGVISGAGYEAVKVDALMREGLGSFWTRRHPIDDNSAHPTPNISLGIQQTLVKTATAVAQRFTTDHQLAVAANLMAIGDKSDNELEAIAHELHKIFVTPASWRQNQSLVWYYLTLHGVTEARQAVEIMRKIMVFTDNHGILETPLTDGRSERYLQREEREFKEEIQRRNADRGAISPWPESMADYVRYVYPPKSPETGHGA
ncbi:hypothetical protein CLAFUW4_12006 [Fulvia fulva]|uniref:Uncharacterized protein n=1 Tax=Passalora fulva TaxID=5499 RepID=A0A9Q8PEE0_PASFU|nr:uncharacterized protein CLAFUR5_11045 [Fulvia fulva]KAK4618333.1 hypothetical protein CLAFUR4_12011 [Fulvia fulva]KAK4619142.1 hypothetical protein CLAFUR0_12022 [Fulvia fulva]UJO20943.1 hypothetical protein CLAFUR5_11045 [Fulvia fulva]WPV18552.1 hypothetical protein CLAFUW4_12006 [Fulvia fulva]WPV32970.1 hypothetical protein CLAFUW7_12013 [Fulvia fulva]